MVPHKISITALESLIFPGHLRLSFFCGHERAGKVVYDWSWRSWKWQVTNDETAVVYISYCFLRPRRKVGRGRKEGFRRVE